MTQANSSIVDSVKVVHDRQSLSGTLSVAELVRLAEDLQCKTGNLDYWVRGDVDRQDRPLLRLRVSGAVQLQCQRCLEGFEFGIMIDTALRLVAAEALESEQNDNPDEPDCIAASTTLDLAAVVEDEVLLALPAYPRHEEGQCNTAIRPAGNTDADPYSLQGGAKIMAFSALQALKQKTNPSKE